MFWIHEGVEETDGNGFDALLLAVDDAVVQPLAHVHLQHRVRPGGVLLGAALVVVAPSQELPGEQLACRPLAIAPLTAMRPQIADIDAPRNHAVADRRVEREQDFIREDQYGLLRRDLPARGRGPSLRSLLSGADVRDVALLPDSLAVGQTLRALDLRAETGVTLLGIERAGELLANPSPDTPLLVGDVLVLFGTGEGVTKATQMLAGAAGAQ